MKDEQQIAIIGYDELSAKVHEKSPNARSIELKNNCCHGAPMRVFYSLAHETFETLFFRCVVCNEVVMKIRVGCSEDENDAITL
jgi:hypothetical protein